jgi:hypothetical protein
MKPWSLLRLFLGLLFTVTGLAKLLDNRSFAQVIASYQLGLPGLFLLPLGLCIRSPRSGSVPTSCARGACA